MTTAEEAMVWTNRVALEVSLQEMRPDIRLSLRTNRNMHCSSVASRAARRRIGVWHSRRLLPPWRDYLPHGTNSQTCTGQQHCKKLIEPSVCEESGLFIITVQKLSVPTLRSGVACAVAAELGCPETCVLLSSHTARRWWESVRILSSTRSELY